MTASARVARRYMEAKAGDHKMVLNMADQYIKILEAAAALEKESLSTRQSGARVRAFLYQNARDLNDRGLSRALSDMVNSKTVTEELAAAKQVRDNIMRAKGEAETSTLWDRHNKMQQQRRNQGWT